MPAVVTIEQFLETVRKSGLLDARTVDTYIESLRASETLPDAPPALARLMLRDGLLTQFQTGQLLQGKARGFILNAKYKLLEHLGAGGMGTVYLCEHTSMRRRVAIKVLPIAKAKDASYLERFYREARAVAALDHPNIVRAHDIDRDGQLHFLVMEYVDGSSLQEIIGKHGALDPVRAAHYMSQAALGLQHAHESGLVHRDIKPGNILVDRSGSVKLLDLGLARFFHDDDNLSKKYDETVLGTSDYLAPEQTLGSDVDIRADIYSLGATFYYCLTGQTLFGEGTAAQKLIWHTTRQPKPITAVQPDVPEAMAEMIQQRMLAKNADDRFREPIEIFDALAPWTATPISPPPEDEMPKLSRAASGPGDGGTGSAPSTLASPGSAARRNWTVAATRSPRPVSGPDTMRRATPTSPTPTGPSTRVAGRNGPPTTKGGSGGGSGTRSGPRSGPRSSSVDITDAPTELRPSGSKPILPGPTSSAIRKTATVSNTPATTPLSPGMLALLGAAVIGPIFLAFLGIIGWSLFLRVPPHPTQQVVTPRPANQGGPAPRGAPAGDRQIHMVNYDATVANDGCLTSLRLGGTEILWVGKTISRGVYFHGQGGPMRLGNIDVKGDVISATSGWGAIHYEFGPDTLTWTASNRTDQPLSFFMVLGPAVTAVANDRGEFAKTPVKQEWTTTTWFAGKSKLTVSGGARIWGPWGEVPGQAFQVWDGSLKPRETRKFVLKVGTVTASEAVRVASVTGQAPAVEADLTLASPLEYQVFQRYARQRGQIVLRGKVRPQCDRLVARVTGRSLEGALPETWKNISFDNKANRTFDTTLPEPAGGWYKLEVRALQGEQVVGEIGVDHVGIGEVFVISGQSNATNCGEEQLKPRTGMVASFSGDHWQLADDPQPGVHDKTGGGSCWPPFGDALFEKYHVPIGIASTGHTGSSVRAWQPGSEYFKWMMGRIRQLGAQGFRAVLWHQGESDVNLTTDEYARLLTKVITTSQKDAGWDFPWIVAQVSYHNPEHPSYPSTRAAQKQLWDKGVAVEGPDTDTLTGDNRDTDGKGIHFSGKGERAHGQLWADKVSAYLDKVLAE
jgi:serine/threonine protein kinase